MAFFDQRTRKSPETLATFPEALNPFRTSKTVSRSVPECTNMKTHTIGSLILDVFDYPPVVLCVDCQKEVRIGIYRGEIDRPPSEPEKILVCPKCEKSGVATVAELRAEGIIP